MIKREKFFDQPINDNKVTYESIRKIATGKGDDYTTGCLLDYTYFIDNYEIIALDLSRKQALDADPRAIQQIMTQYNSLNVKLSNSQLNKLNSAIKNGTDVVLR